MWKRKLFAALCTAVPLFAIAPAAQAQPILNAEQLLCSGIPEERFGQATLFLPNIISTFPHFLYWGALVYHYLPDGTLTNTEWTGWYLFTPQDPATLVGIGGWNHGTYVTTAWTLGYVSTHVYLFDWTAQQWIYGPQLGPNCLVFTTFQ
jgi:hypothetical protein